jgi:hypothetical protein
MHVPQVLAEAVQIHIPAVSNTALHGLDSCSQPRCIYPHTPAALLPCCLNLLDLCPAVHAVSELHTS